MASSGRGRLAAGSLGARLGPRPRLLPAALRPRAAAPATGSGGDYRINPPDDTEVGPDTALVYLADHPRLPAA